MAKSTDTNTDKQRIKDLEELARTQKELIETQRKLIEKCDKLNQSDEDSLFHSRRHNDFLMDSIAQLIFSNERQASPQASQEVIEEAVRQRMARVFEALQQDISEGRSDAETVRGLFNRVFPPLYSEQIAALHPAPPSLPPHKQAAFDILTKPEGADKKLILYYMDLIADAPSNKLMYEHGLLPMVMDERTKTDFLQRKELKEALALLRKGMAGSDPSTMDNYVGKARMVKQAKKS